MATIATTGPGGGDQQKMAAKYASNDRFIFYFRSKSVGVAPSCRRAPALEKE
ncbi:hypothetical protein M8494_32970 [Serratia ureilytica]